MTNRILRDYGMILVLIALVALFSLLSLNYRMPGPGTSAAELVSQVAGRFAKDDLILAVGAANTDSATVIERTVGELQEAGYTNVRTIIGAPRDLRVALDETKTNNTPPAAILVAGDAIGWLDQQLPTGDPALERVAVFSPHKRLRSTFLRPTNLLAVVDRIVVIAVIAIGMTMVIIAAGIDLSVGSLIALSAVVAATVMSRLGGTDAPDWAVAAGFLAGALACGAVGLATGLLIARFKVAPFIVTLSTMLMVRGLAFRITGGYSIDQLPAAVTWLGQGRSVGIPNTVILLVVLYAAAHIFMSRTRLGRYIYATGGNEEAARLSGVPIGWVTTFVYTASGLAAGLGGCIQMSQVNSGTPNLGTEVELKVIAAVVIGGTSLAGGSGRIMGTLIGAFIIAVIENGMNVLGVDAYTQKIVLGAVILLAVLLDKARSRIGQTLWRRKAPQ